jgi:heme-degrading monooxygenase HmoA
MVNKNIILEISYLQIQPGKTDLFERAFRVISSSMLSMKGYISHELQRCLEAENRYILFVRWEKEDNTVGFRRSPEYEQWCDLLYNFYDLYPTVEYYEQVFFDQKYYGRF